jgi:hypothetical protein
MDEEMDEENDIDVKTAIVPLTDKPGMGDGERQIGADVDNTVTILERVNDKFYKVKSGNTIGYIWAGWFK